LLSAVSEDAFVSAITKIALPEPEHKAEIIRLNHATRRTCGPAGSLSKPLNEVFWTRRKSWSPPVFCRNTAKNLRPVVGLNDVSVDLRRSWKLLNRRFTKI
jgi:hypothetical protein